MRFNICFKQSGKVSITFENSKEEKEGCIFRIDKKVLTKGKITVYTEGEHGFPCGKDGFHEESADNLGKGEMLEFLETQYARVGRNLPESIKKIVRFMCGTDDDTDGMCYGEHLPREEVGTIEGDNSLSRIVTRFTNDICQELRVREYGHVERAQTIENILATFVLVILATGAPTGASASDNFVNNRINNIGPCQELLYNGFNGNEQSMFSGLSEGWFNGDAMVLVKRPEICDSESSEGKCADDRQGGANSGRVCLRVGERRFMPNREMPMGLHVHSTLEQLPPTSDNHFTNPAGVHMCGETDSHDSDEVGIQRVRGDPEESFVFISFLTFVLAMVKKMTISKWMILALVIISVDYSFMGPRTAEASETGESTISTSTTLSTTISTTMKTGNTTITSKPTTELTTISTTVSSLTTEKKPSHRGRLWDETILTYLDYEVKIEKYKKYSLNGRKVLFASDYNGVTDYVWEDNWREDALQHKEHKLEGANSCDKYNCTYVVGYPLIECSLPVPESTIKLNNKTYYIDSKPFESGFISNTEVSKITGMKKTGMGLKNVISCSHNQDIYATIDTEICVVKNVSIDGKLWENCVYSCDICARYDSDPTVNIVEVAIDNSPTWLPDAARVFDCRKDDRLESHQRLCWSSESEYNNATVVEFGKDVTRFVKDQQYGAVCQWNDSPNVNIRTCWCRQMMKIYITDCRLLGEEKSSRAWKGGKVGSIYLFEKGHEWRIVLGKYVSVSAKSEEVEYRVIDAISFGWTSMNYVTKYGILTTLNANPNRCLISQKLEISMVRTLGDNMILTQKTREAITSSKFIATNTYDDQKKRIMSLLTENRKNYTIYEGSSWYWYGAMKGCGSYGPETFCTNNVLQECKLYDGKLMRNACMMMGSSPSRNGWLTAVYVLAGYLCTGGMSQLFHIGRFILYLMGKKKPYYRKMIWLQSYCLSWCYGSDLDIKHQMLSTGGKLHRLRSYLKNDGKLTINKTEADYSWHETINTEMSEDEMFRELCALDNNPRFTINSSYIRRKMRFIIFWMPQWMYLAILLQFVWSLLTFWNVGLYYWYTTRQLKKLHDETSALFEPMNSAEEKEEILNSSKTRAMKNNATFTTVIVQKRALKERFHPKTRTHKNLLRFLGIVFWIMIGRIECVTRTYTINCNDGDCERAIDVDEQMMLTNDSSLQIDLKNPDSGEIDGNIIFKVISLDMRVIGTYDFSTVQSGVDHYEVFSDGSDCDGDCSTVFTAMEDTDFGDLLNGGELKRLMEYGQYAWATRVETSGFNHGFCAGMVAIKPLWNSDMARSFKLTNTESIATIEMSVVTDSENIKETFLTTLNGKNFNFGNDNKIQFIEEVNQFADLSNERITCFFEAGRLETNLRDCASGADGINSGLALRTVGEGSLGFTAWRSPALTNSITSSISSCNDCNTKGSRGCNCECQHVWSTPLLERFNKEDVKNMGTSEPPTDCMTKVVVSELEEAEPKGICLDWNIIDKDECEEMCPDDLAPCWIDRTVKKPRSIDISSSGCSGGRFSLKASIKSKYDSSTVSNVVSSSDIDVVGTGCWGTIYSYQITYTATNKGVLYLVSDTLQVPSIINIASSVGTFNGTASLDLNQYYFYILDEDGTKVLMTVSGGLEACDGIVDGGNGEQGSSDIDTGLAEKAWLYWLMAILSVIFVVLLLICLMKCLMTNKRSDVVIRDKTD